MEDKHKIEISLVNVNRQEIEELRDYLKKNCWKWEEIDKQATEPMEWIDESNRYRDIQ